MVVVGRIARAHGNRGQVIVDPATDFPDERFKAGSVLFIRRGEATEAVDGRERPVPPRAADYRLGGHRHDGRGRSARRAASFVSAPTRCSRCRRARIYHHDLIGCAVETPRGEQIGRVRAVEGDAAGSRLVVESTSGDVLIPMAEGICVEIDVAGRKDRGRAARRAARPECDETSAILDFRLWISGSDALRYRHDFSSDDRGGARRGDSREGDSAQICSRFARETCGSSPKIATAPWTTCRMAADRGWS